MEDEKLQLNSKKKKREWILQLNKWINLQKTLKHFGECFLKKERKEMSYMSDYEHGGDEFEYEQCCAEENRKDRIEREEYYREEEDDERE